MAPKRKHAATLPQAPPPATVTLGDMTWPDLMTFLNDVRVVLGRNPTLALEVQNVALKRLVSGYQGQAVPAAPEPAP